MNYQLFLFDLDHTLFDFERSESYAFFRMLEEQGISDPDPQWFLGYIKINRELWENFEKGLITKGQVKSERFRKLSDLYALPLDIERATETYLERLCDTTYLIEHAYEVCLQLRNKSKIGIITNGIEKVQRKRLSESEIVSLVDFMVVSEECGYQKPDVRIFEYALAKAGHAGNENVLMVGDRLDTDIKGASDLGIHTCWFNDKKVENTSGICPTFEISDLRELLGSPIIRPE